MGNQECCSNDIHSAKNDTGTIKLHFDTSQSEFNSIIQAKYETQSNSKRQYNEESIVDDDIPNYKRINSDIKSATKSNRVENKIKPLRLQKKKPPPLQECEIPCNFQTEPNYFKFNFSNHENCISGMEESTTYTTIGRDIEIQYNSALTLSENSPRAINSESNDFSLNPIKNNYSSSESKSSSFNDQIPNSKNKKGVRKRYILTKLPKNIGADIKSLKENSFNNFNSVPVSSSLYQKEIEYEKQSEKNKTKPKERKIIYESENIETLKRYESDCNSIYIPLNDPSEILNPSNPIIYSEDALVEEKNNVFEIKDNEILTFRTVSDSEKIESRKDNLFQTKESNVTLKATLDHQTLGEIYSDNQEYITPTKYQNEERRIAEEHLKIEGKENDRFQELRKNMFNLVSPEESAENFRVIGNIKPSSPKELQSIKKLDLRGSKTDFNKNKKSNKKTKTAFNSRIQLMENIIKSKLNGTDESPSYSSLSRGFTDRLDEHENYSTKNFDTRVDEYLSIDHEKF